MNIPVFYDLEKQFRRKLKHTARFYTVDLHCHTPLSHCFGRKDGVYQDDIQATAEQVAIAGCERGLYLLAITDHHRCEKSYDISAACQEIKSSGQPHRPLPVNTVQAGYPPPCWLRFPSAPVDEGSTLQPFRGWLKEPLVLEEGYK